MEDYGYEKFRFPKDTIIRESSSVKFPGNITKLVTGDIIQLKNPTGDYTSKMLYPATHMVAQKESITTKQTATVANIIPPQVIKEPVAVDKKPQLIAETNDDSVESSDILIEVKKPGIFRRIASFLRNIFL